MAMNEPPTTLPSDVQPVQPPVEEAPLPTFPTVQPQEIQEVPLTFEMTQEQEQPVAVPATPVLVRVYRRCVILMREAYQQSVDLFCFVFLKPMHVVAAQLRRPAVRTAVAIGSGVVLLGVIVYAAGVVPYDLVGQAKSLLLR